jgi:hypothetical protein
MPKYKGFSFKEKWKMGSVISDAKYCIHFAQKEAFKDYKGFIKRADKYFDLRKSAGGAEAATHLIMKTVSSMRLTIDSDMYVIIKGGDAGNTNADMMTISQEQVNMGGGDRRWQAKQSRLQGTIMYAGKPINMLEARMISFGQKGSAPMTLYKGFFALSHKLNDQQSQVETFLHELSHGAAGTHDVDEPKCYGMQGVDFCKKQGSATRNAENYGFFLQSYLFG